MFLALENTSYLNNFSLMASAKLPSTFFLYVSVNSVVIYCMSQFLFTKLENF